MAVGFFPDEDERYVSIRASMASTTNSATQTPLQSPVNREFLVQAFCEAIQRVSITSEYSIQNDFLLYLFPLRHSQVNSSNNNIILTDQKLIVHVT